MHVVDLDNTRWVTWETAHITWLFFPPSSLQAPHGIQWGALPLLSKEQRDSTSGGHLRSVYSAAIWHVFDMPFTCHSLLLFTSPRRIDWFISLNDMFIILFSRRLCSIHYIAKRWHRIVNCQTGYLTYVQCPTFGRLGWLRRVQLSPNPYPSFTLSPSCLLSPTIFRRPRSTDDFK